MAFGVCNTDGVEGLSWAEVEQCQVCKNEYENQLLLYRSSNCIRIEGQKNKQNPSDLLEMY